MVLKYVELRILLGVRNMQSRIVISYKILLTIRLSDVSEWNNEREMIIPKELMEKEHLGNVFTVEFLDGDGEYMIRAGLIKD